MENAKITKIQKAASVTANVLKAIKIILIVGLVITIVGGIFGATGMATFEETIKIFGHPVRILGPFGEIEEGINEGLEAAKVNGFAFIDALDIKDLSLRIAANCFAAAVCIAIALTCVIIIRKAFTRIAESETPFNSAILKDVRNVGILVTILVLMNSIGIAAIVALTFWCIYCVFDYGIELQKSADETL